jgi:hypothetical protein
MSQHRPTDPPTDCETKTQAVDTLRLTQQLREYHHKALWEEEKHFTWLLSIILAAQAAILTTKAADLPARGAILVALAAIGLVFVIVALLVVRREGEFFVNAHRLFVTRYNLVFPNQELKAPSAKANRTVFLLPFLLFAPWMLSIRDAFQLVLLFFGAVDLGLLVAVLKAAV